MPRENIYVSAQIQHNQARGGFAYRSKPYIAGVMPGSVILLNNKAFRALRESRTAISAIAKTHIQPD